MKINTNRWNRIRYTLYTPGYDFAARILRESRKKSIESLGVKPNDRILIIGAGTGLDLEFLPADCEITAIDYTPAMVERMIKRNKTLKCNLKAMVMDGQALELADSSFDKVILHLILAVIPDPIACIKEAERVIKFGGEVAVYDKFVRKGAKVSFLRKATNILTSTMFSDITRDFESIVGVTKFRVITDTDADFNGNFRLIKMIKQ
jgi:phosphatidylethanolamine/phosphatidyl-N-methylethanolamine N-methyltransferase